MLLNERDHYNNIYHTDDAHIGVDCCSPNYGSIIIIQSEIFLPVTVQSIPVLTVFQVG